MMIWQGQIAFLLLVVVLLKANFSGNHDRPSAAAADSLYAALLKSREGEQPYGDVYYHVPNVDPARPPSPSPRIMPYHYHDPHGRASLPTIITASPRVDDQHQRRNLQVIIPGLGGGNERPTATGTTGAPVATAADFPSLSLESRTWVYFIITMGFDAGAGRPPTVEEVEEMMCFNNDYIRDRVQMKLTNRSDTRPVKVVARLIHWTYSDDADNELPLNLTFFGDTRYIDDDSPVDKAAVFGSFELTNAELGNFIQNYIWKVSEINVFFYVFSVNYRVREGEQKPSPENIILDRTYCGESKPPTEPPVASPTSLPAATSATSTLVPTTAASGSTSATPVPNGTSATTTQVPTPLVSGGSTTSLPVAPTAPTVSPANNNASTTTTPPNATPGPNTTTATTAPSNATSVPGAPTTTPLNSTVSPGTPTGTNSTLSPTTTIPDAGLNNDTDAPTVPNDNNNTGNTGNNDTNPTEPGDSTPTVLPQTVAPGQPTATPTNGSSTAPVTTPVVGGVDNPFGGGGGGPGGPTAPPTPVPLVPVSYVMEFSWRDQDYIDQIPTEEQVRRMLCETQLFIQQRMRVATTVPDIDAVLSRMDWIRFTSGDANTERELSHLKVNMTVTCTFKDGTLVSPTIVRAALDGADAYLLQYFLGRGTDEVAGSIVAKQLEHLFVKPRQDEAASEADKDYIFNHISHMNWEEYPIDTQLPEGQLQSLDCKDLTLEEPPKSLLGMPLEPSLLAEIPNANNSDTGDGGTNMTDGVDDGNDDDTGSANEGLTGNTPSADVTTGPGSGPSTPVPATAPVVSADDSTSTPVQRVDIDFIVSNFDAITIPAEVNNSGLSASFPLFVESVVRRVALGEGQRFLRTRQLETTTVQLEPGTAYASELIRTDCGEHAALELICHKAKAQFDLRRVGPEGEAPTSPENEAAVAANETNNERLLQEWTTAYTVEAYQAINDGTFYDIMKKEVPDTPLFIGTMLASDQASASNVNDLTFWILIGAVVALLVCLMCVCAFLLHQRRSHQKEMEEAERRAREKDQLLESDGEHHDRYGDEDSDEVEYMDDYDDDHADKVDDGDFVGDYSDNFVTEDAYDVFEDEHPEEEKKDTRDIMVDSSDKTPVVVNGANRQSAPPPNGFEVGNDGELSVDSSVEDSSNDGETLSDVSSASSSSSSSSSNPSLEEGMDDNVNNEPIQSSLNENRAINNDGKVDEMERSVTLQEIFNLSRPLSDSGDDSKGKAPVAVPPTIVEDDHESVQSSWAEEDARSDGRALHDLAQPDAIENTRDDDDAKNTSQVANDRAVNLEAIGQQEVAKKSGSSGVEWEDYNGSGDGKNNSAGAPRSNGSSNMDWEDYNVEGSGSKNNSAGTPGSRGSSGVDWEEYEGPDAAAQKILAARNNESSQEYKDTVQGLAVMSRQNPEEQIIFDEDSDDEDDAYVDTVDWVDHSSDGDLPDTSSDEDDEDDADGRSKEANQTREMERTRDAFAVAAENEKSKDQLWESYVNDDSSEEFSEEISMSSPRRR